MAAGKVGFYLQVILLFACR